MKQKKLIRFLSCVLASVMLIGTPLQTFAAEMETGVSETIVEEDLEDTEILDEVTETQDTLFDDIQVDSVEEQEPDTVPDTVEEENGDIQDEQQELPAEVPEEAVDTIQPENGEEMESPAVEENVVDKAVNITSIELSDKKLELEIGTTKQLSVSAFSNGSSVENFSSSWRSSDSTVVLVRSSGIVEAKSVGTATVTVEVNGIEASCEITVIKPIASITLDKTNVTLKKNQKTKLEALIAPADTTESKTLTWSSDNTNIAVVDTTGLVTAKNAGTAIITVSTASKKEARCIVTVLSEEFKTGWQLHNGVWYYYDLNGSMQTGWLKINGVAYYLNDSGAMQTGWTQVNGKWYYMSSSGAVQTGWQKIDGKWYYLNVDGSMQTGWKQINSKWYYFSSSGAMQTGWIQLNNRWYYFGSGGEMQVGRCQISGVWYCFNVNGEMQTGWYQEAGKWYYMSASGVMKFGWQTIGGAKYYFAKDGVMQTGWYQEAGKWYYFGNNGTVTGWYTIGSAKYYFAKDGVMKTGWHQEAGKWYYFGNNGAVTGWQTIGGAKYYFAKDGVMQTGWYQESGKWYYFGSNGAVTGWQTISNVKYYFTSNGVMQTGWQQIDNKWYYFTSSGAMKTGWFQQGPVWYYLKSDGSMATSNTTIDGEVNAFDSNGVWKGIVKSGIKAYGIDVSSNQGTINWKKVAKDDIDFAMLRIVTGKGSSMARDTKFKEYYDDARDAGIDVGVYRYSYATSRTQAKEEADAVIDALNGRKLDYPVVLDVEDSSILSGTSSNARRSEIILAFKERIESKGYKFALYANITWLTKYLDMNMLKDVDIWVARWRSLDSGHGYTGKGNVTMWQYSSSGKVDGISGKVDLNVSYKNY